MAKFIEELENEAECYAQGYAEVGYDEDEIASVRDAFIDGAKWQRNCVWHKPSEEPDEDKEVFYEWDTADAILHEVGFYHKDTKDFSKDHKHQRYMSEVAKWAYVEDLVAF